MKWKMFTFDARKSFLFARDDGVEFLNEFRMWHSFIREGESSATVHSKNVGFRIFDLKRKVEAERLTA